MTKKLQFGICFLQFIPIQQIIKRCQFVGALGYDNVRIFNQYFNPFQVNDPLWEEWTLLATAAAATGHSIGRRNHKYTGFQPIEAGRLHMAMSSIAITS